jgi:hypothetical protein
MHNGYIKLHRPLLKHWVFEDPAVFKVWTYCLLRAAWQDSEFKFSKSSEVIRLKRGEFVTGRAALHKACFPPIKRQGKSAAPPHTSMTTWRILKSLEKCEMLSMTSFNQYTIVSICNYDTYQDVPGEVVQEVEQRMFSGCSADVHKEEKKETKKVKKQRDDDYSPEFLSWYAKYPKRAAKRPAFTAWKNAVERIEKATNKSRLDVLAFLERQAQAYAHSPAGNRGQFTPAPAPWLNQDRFDDDPSAWQVHDDTAKPEQEVDLLIHKIQPKSERTP